MGSWLPERKGGAMRRARRSTALAGFVVLALGLSGCSTETQAGRFGMPEAVTTQGEEIVALWQGAWIAALATGIVTWGLIIGAATYYRRRSDDEVPIQTRYNLPIEIFYTIFPIVMVVVFFSHTVRVQNVALELDPNPDVNIVVTGQKWTWTFNYPEAGPGGENIFVSGPPPGQAPEGGGANLPELVIPVDSTVHFELVSPDVIHDFGVPAFAMRMDVVPGTQNAFQVTTTEEGEFAGKCYELCGAYHSRMLFTVRIVSQNEYDDYLDTLAAEVDEQGNPTHLSQEPLTGGDYAVDPYLNRDETESGTEGEHE